MKIKKLSIIFIILSVLEMLKSCVPNAQKSDCDDYSVSSCGEYKNCQRTQTFPNVLCVCASKFCNTFEFKSGLCDVCNQGYALTAYFQYCVPIIEKCKLYDDNSPTSKCINCIIPYVPSEFGNACVNPINNCQIYYDSGKCRICNSGYNTSSDENECIFYIDYCLKMITDKCAECQANYALTLSETKCVPIINDCSIYYDSGTCSTCNEGYNKTINGKKCVSPINNCGSYDDVSGLCIYCLGNNNLTETGAHCVPIIEKCLKYDDFTLKCKICQNNYVLFLNNSECIIGIQNCYKYNEINQTCDICSYGFERTGNGIKCVNSISDCTSYDDSTGNCKECKQQYSLSYTRKSCVLNIDNCSTYDDNLTCKECNSVFVLSQTHKKCCNNINNCINYSDIYGDCLNCISGFVFIQKKTVCVPGIKNCIIYNDIDGTCQTCNNNFERTENGYMCANHIDNCIDYDDLTGNCINCNSNYPINNKFHCYMQIDQCSIQDSSNLSNCLECNEKFHITVDSLKCVPTIQFCMGYNNDGKCLQCSNNTYPINNNKSCEVVASNKDHVDFNPTLIVEIVIPCTFVLICLIISLIIYYKRRHKKELNELKQNLINNVDSDHNVILIEKPISLESAIKIFWDFIENEKLKLEHFVFDIIDHNDNFKKNQMKLKIIQKIGKGGYGTVYKVTDYLDNIYALKIFIDKNGSDILNEQDINKFKEMITEKLHLRDLKNENVIYMTGIASSFQPERLILGIVEPYMRYDLKSFLQYYSNNLALNRRIEIALSISKGLYYLHFRKFSHNDIKPQNILINWPEEIGKIDVKISDFGTMKKEYDIINQDIGLTLEYASPERILKYLDHLQLDKENFIKSDIWSLGCVFIKIFSNDFNEKFKFPWIPYLSNNNEVVKTMIIDEENQNNEYFFEQEIPEKIIEIINECLQVKVEKRLKIEKIIEELNEVQKNNQD